MPDELMTERDGALLRVTFNRPDQRNAMTWAMYEGLHDACETADADDGIRAMVLRGAGTDAFIAGTDIGQFRDFASGDDGIAYEEKISRITGRLERVAVPTIAVIDGYCVGGGLAIAAVCDLRVASPSARFGVPIARTLGNCLSMNTYSLLLSHLGPSRTLDLLLRARMLPGEDAYAAGFVTELVDSAELDEAGTRIAERLVQHAPLSMWAAKEAVRRLRVAGLPDGDDIVSAVFGSEDFRSGVRSFLAKEKPEWVGR